MQPYGSLPHQPGVYQFLDDNGEVLYVGKAKDLRNRVSSYFQNKETLIGKTRILVEQIKQIRTTIVESELESLLLEAALIKKYNPKYNIRLTDGKAYPLIRLTAKAEFPAVLTARRVEDAKSLYFGPYPSAGSMRSVLHILRRIFPFQSVLNHPKRKCLYNHLGLCPCPPLFTTNSQRKEYKKTIHHIAKFLDGDIKDVVRELEKERDTYAESEAYEKAQKVQKQLDDIARVTQPFTDPFEYVTNPNLREDMRQKEMEDLQRVLRNKNVFIELPTRIECYDNSNIQGTNPVASMVVLTNGEIDKSQYRKFKIRSVTGPDDFASMKEVFTRRLKHTEWPLPQLFIVDGGKGQVSVAKEILNDYFKRHPELLSAGRQDASGSLPLIGLAKRMETIITSDLEEIHIPKSSPALQLVMRIRDEAHRFAITFHRKLRSQNSFK